MKRVLPDVSMSVDSSPYVDPSFSADVITWQKQHGRHVLPWQNTRDAYRVWLSEIMLQQTQVAAVIPYYQRFLNSFPDVHSLAAAPSEEVMSHWSGLGYYTRARNLHRCAQWVVAQYAGRFPEDPALLADLPGIGRSTAAAIAAFSYGRRAAILDGNVKRVFARVFGVEGYPGAKAIEDKLWLRAVALLPENGIEAYTQGLMDLGATLCTRSRPACERCPLAQRCEALKTDRVAVLPERKPKKKVPERQVIMMVVQQEGRILMEQRPDSGIWGGLLSLPEMDMTEDVAALDAQVQATLGLTGETGACRPLPAFTHVFTHFKLHVQPYYMALPMSDTLPIAPYLWYDLDNMALAPLPAPVKKLLLGDLQQQDLLSGLSV